MSTSSNPFAYNRFKCNINNANRRIRKFFGRPASRDAATLSKFLSKTRTVIEAELGSPVTSIAPTIFNIHSEQEQDMSDALDFVRLQSSRERSQSAGSGLNTAYVDSEPNAAFAGLNMGMCHDWQDTKACELETRRNPERSVLYINFDNSSLTASAHRFTSPYQSGMYKHVADADLGWWNLPVFEVPRAKFWAKVHEAIAQVGEEMHGMPGRIVLMGEHGADQEFREVVDAALGSVLDVHVAEMLKVNRPKDTLYLAARGAAELGWRHRSTWEGNGANAVASHAEEDESIEL